MTELRHGGCLAIGVSIAVAVIVASAGGAQAQSVAQVEQTWRDWMSRHNLATGGMAIVQGGKAVHEAAMGRFRVGMPARQASLSKAVTGVCVAGLVEKGSLSFDMPTSRALARTFARVGQPADNRLGTVTIAQLLAHRAGFGRDGGDPTTSSTTLSNYLRRATAKDTAFDAQVKWTIARPLESAPGERYAYSNASYLLLGAIIEEATGATYESYCRDTVLAKLGAAGATLDPSLRFLSSYGGWRMPLADYGRFYQAFALGNPAIGPKARAWMMSPEGKSIGGGAHYGLGTMVRPVASGDANFWHWGSWRYSLSDAFDGPMSDSWSTFAVRWGAAGTNVVVYQEPQVGEGNARSELDRSLGQAISAVRTWP